MNLFELMAKITLDSSEYESGLSKAANVAKSAFGTIAKIGTVAVGAAATGIGTIVKQSVDAYGSYEQLAGGVETLFGKSAQKVMNDAADAFQTAGMSMNDYMETSIQSAASLINSLGGDQAKAAELMNMSITDMSDNVNKMGTTMEAVQNAYRGFSRGNFTMLDNLALGFAGTKEGMQELLDKAQEISGVKYDISSYSDIVEAIHVVQTEMGITGTTAKEAATTIQGSLNSVKAAWQNLLTGLSNKNANMKLLAKNLATSVGTAVNNIVPAVKQALSGIGEAINELAPSLLDAANDLISDVLPDLITAAVGLLRNIGEAVVKNTGSLLDAGQKIIDSLVDGILTASGNPDFSSAAQNVISQFSNFVLRNVDNVADAALIVVDNLTDGIANALESVDAETFGEKAVSLVGKLASAIGHAASAILPAAADVLTAFVNGLLGGDEGLESPTGDLQKGAADLVNGLASGISGAADNIVSAVPVLLQSLVTGLVEQLPYYLGLLAGKIGEIIKNLFSGEGAVGSLFMGVLTGITGQTDKAAEYFSKLAEKIDPNQNPDLMKAIVNFGVGMRKGFFTDAEIQEQADKVKKVAEAGSEAADETGKAFNEADLSINTEPAEQGLQKVVSIADANVQKLFNSGDEGGKQYDDGIVKGIDKNSDQVQTAAEGIKDKVDVDLGDDGENVGASWSNGLIRGMLSLSDKVAATANHLAGIITNGTMNTLEVKSPSRVARRIAEYWDVGLIEGMQKKMEDVRKQSEKVASTIITNIEYPSVNYSSMTGSVATGTSATNGWGDAVGAKLDELGAKIDALADAILHQTWELDGDVVAESVDRRLGSTAAMKARA